MEQILFHIQDTIIHKKLVLDSCFILCKYLFSIGDKDTGIQLMQRAMEHDNSKFHGTELESISQITDNFHNFKDPNLLLSSVDAEKIKEHWKNNRHHPEHFKNVEDMTDLDLMEMVCDWFARSIQYNTNFMEFVKIRQENRFHFPQDMFDKIYRYCEIIVKEKQKEG